MEKKESVYFSDSFFLQVLGYLERLCSFVNEYIHQVNWGSLVYHSFLFMEENRMDRS